MKNFILFVFYCSLVYCQSLGQVEKEFFEAWYNRDIDTLAQLAPAVAVSARDSIQNTPLHVAVSTGDTDMVKLFLKKGFDINAQNYYGHTPLTFINFNPRGVYRLAYPRNTKKKIIKMTGVELLLDDIGVLGWIASSSSNRRRARIEYSKNNYQKTIDKQREDKEAPGYVLPYENYIDIVELLVNNGSDLNIRDKKGYTLLDHFEIPFHEYNSDVIEILKYYIDHGAQFYHKKNANLINIILANEISKVESVLDTMANINNYVGEYPVIYLGVLSNRSKIIELMINKGADVNLTENDQIFKRYNKLTPLHFACLMGNPEIVQLLIDNGAEINSRTVFDETPFTLALGKEEIRDLLIKKGALDFQKMNKQLFAAIDSGYTDSVKVLLEQGVDVLIFNHQSADKATPLHHAVRKGNRDIVQTLIQYGSDINAVTVSGLTPLHLACFNKNIEIVKFLVDKNANIYARNSDGFTPIDFACDSTEIVDLLKARAAKEGVNYEYSWLKKPENIYIDRSILQMRDRCKAVLRQERMRQQRESRQKKSFAQKSSLKPLNNNYMINPYYDYGKRKLLKASENGNFSEVQELIENNIDINTYDHFQKTPLHHAASEGHIKIVKLLMENGADVKREDKNGLTPLYEALDGDHPDIFKLFIEKETNVNLKNRYGYTLLQRACMGGKTNVVEVLLKKGAEIDVQNDRGKTLLHMACEGGYADIAQLLIKRGADFEVQNQDDKRAIHLAAGKGLFDVVNLLIKKGADVHAEAEGTRRRTPLFYASRNDHENVVKLLIKNGADINPIDFKQLSYNVEKIGEITPFGLVKWISTQGNYAYLISNSAKLCVLNIANPQQPGVVSITELENDYSSITVSDGIAYLIDEEGRNIHLYDISDPANVRMIGSMDTLREAKHICLSGKYAYIADGHSGLRVLEISNSGKSHEVAVYDPSGTSNNFVWVHDQYAFLSEREGTLIIDISDPSKMETVGKLTINAYDMCISGSHLFVAAGSDGLQIFDIADISNPQRLNSFVRSGEVFKVAVYGDYAYLANTNKGIQILDISNINRLKELGLYHRDALYRYVGGEKIFNSVCFSKNIAYAVHEHNILRIIDLSEPRKPTEINHFHPQWSAIDFDIRDGYGYIADTFQGLLIVDLKNQRNMNVVGFISRAGCRSKNPWLSIHSYHHIFIYEDYAFLVNDCGLEIINIKNPRQPRFVSEFKTGSYALDVYVHKNVAYITVPDSGLYLLDIADPANPKQLNFIGMNARGIRIHNDFALVTDSIGLRIYNISDITNLRQTGFCPTPGAGGKIYVHDQIAYIMFHPLTMNESQKSSYGDIYMIDVLNPSAPYQRGVYNSTWSVQGISFSNKYAFVGDGISLIVMDISDPGKLVHKAFYKIEDLQAVHIDRNYIYVLRRHGLGVYRYTGEN